MKINRIWLLIFAAVVLIAVLLFWKHPIQYTVTSMPTIQAKVQTTNSQTSLASNTNIAVSGNLIVSNQIRGKATQDDRLRLPEIYEVYNATHNIPIKFYGQVINQNSNPVPDVKINVTIRQQYVKSPTERSGYDMEIPMEVSSGEDGHFVIQGEKGDSLHIDSIQKDGYQLSPKLRRGYGYVGTSDPFHPDPQNPIIIYMYRKSEPQNLISHHLSRIGIIVDGQPTQFDLFGGKKVLSGGQLIVRLKRDPQILPPGNARYDWSLELEVPNGGMITNNDEFMYQAPESGYEEKFKIEMPKTAANWTTDFDQQFYFQLENGKYFGSLVIHLSTIHDTPPLGINLDIVINPSGSQSLQP